MLVLAGWSSPPRVHAQQPLREQTALKFIPDDAAYFSSSLRIRQQVAAFASSKAFAKLSGLPFVKSAVDEVKQAWSADAKAEQPATDGQAKPSSPPKANGAEDDDEPDNDGAAAESVDLDLSDFFAGVKLFWSDPDNRQLVGLGLDALSQEVFVYGDSTIVGFLNALVKLNVDVSSFGQFGLAGAELTPESPQIQALLDEIDKLPVPAFVIGFKLSANEPALAQLARLEKFLQEVLKEYPAVAAGLRREKIGSGEYLSLKLEGSKIPWDELLDDADESDEASTGEQNGGCGDDGDADGAIQVELDPQARKLIKALAVRLKTRSLTLSLGLQEGYLLFSFGETNAHLAKMFANGKKLIDRPELAPLLKFADKPLTAISYTSQEVSRAAQNSSSSVGSLEKFLETWGEQFGLDQEAREKLLKDLTELATEAAARLPEPGALVDWQCLTSRGYERYSYDFGGGDKSLDGSKKLSILEHIGSDPLIVVAARRKGQLDGYRFLAKCLSVMSVHLDGLVGRNLPDPYGEQYSRIKGAAAPLVEKFHAITAGQFLPALADGESAFVLDARSSLKQLPPPLPVPVEPLPIPAPALVYGVSDAALLKQACGGYFALLQETADVLSRLFPEEIPAIMLPPPDERDVKGGKLYYYAIPGAAEGETTIAATGGLGAEVAVLSLIPEQAERLLTKSGFAPADILARRDQPAARLWYVNFAGLMESLETWVNYGFNVAIAFAPSPELPEISQTVETIFEVLKCWRGSAGVAYFEGTTLVEFSETVFEDLK